MADLSVTASQVLPGLESAGATFANGTAGASITAGQAVYLDTAAGTYKLADANDSTATAVVAGIALHAASTGQPLRIQTAGPLTIGAGAAPAVGMIYAVSATAGGIAPQADLTTGHRTSIIGVGTATGVITLRIWATNAVKP